MRGMSARHAVMSVIAYVSTFFKLCMHICYRLTNIIIEAYLHVHYDDVFIKKNHYDNECPIYNINMPTFFVQAGIANLTIIHVVT